MHRQTFEREIAVNRALGSHPNIAQFVKSFSVTNTEGEQRHIIVMPFFARSAADLLTQHSPVEIGALATIARDCLSALCHIHDKQFCFADLKPSNIMLHCGEQGGATLVDFGGVVGLGNPIVERTGQFCLDVDVRQGSELLDWTCLGTTLANLAGIPITRYRLTTELVEFLNDEHCEVDGRVRRLILSCLVNPSGSRIQEALAPLLKPFCKTCQRNFNMMRWRHHCRKCGYSVCDEHSRRKLPVPPDAKPVRVCDECFTPPPSALEHALELAEEEEKTE
ncbi:hypothetical protein PR003_g22918 [Phytophthora rubi]|uniref:Protein kinase domain-containing protein n=1 Tax=Phytophthora rubi TaxID=129364 RepID=A0A6A4D3T3_9STRA|nr:hypothetical protein PR003_g22918 [Phytophthora rubi]